MRRLLLLPAALAAICLPAGAQFQIQDSTTTADLRGIASVGNGIAWASGTHGTILRTEDGGFVWQGCATPPGAEQLDFRGIQAFDAETALVMSSGKGPLSRIYKTTDGCRTWKLVFTNPDAEGFFDAMQAMTRKKLFLLGDPVQGGFAWFETQDQGEHWLRSDAVGLAADADSQGAFAASNSSAMAKGLAFILFGTGGKAGSFIYEQSSSTIISGLGTAQATKDGTSTWSRVPIPFAAGSASAGIFSLTANLQTGALVAVGGDYSAASKTESTAAFRSPQQRMWTLAVTPPHGYRSSVAYDTSTKTWITVGPNGTDISRDDGRNWSPLRPSTDDQADADQHWNALSLPFVVGPKGRIGRLRDGALTPPPRAR